MRRTLVAFFDDVASARGAAKDLLDVGLARGDVRLLGADDPAFLGAADLAARLVAGGAAVAATVGADAANGVREILGRDGVVGSDSAS